MTTFIAIIAAIESVVFLFFIAVGFNAYRNEKRDGLRTRKQSLNPSPVALDRGHCR